ncbi:MAG: hypothetical protein AAGA02_04410, partial [Bacteroidota bacterium]
MNSKRTWTTMLAIGVISFGIYSCDDDDTSIEQAVEEAESAWVYGFGFDTPSGYVSYMGVYEQIPEQADKATAVELGSSASVFSYGENAFIWDSEAVTMTRWSIDKSSLELSVDAILSLASTG